MYAKSTFQFLPWSDLEIELSKKSMNFLTIMINRFGNLFIKRFYWVSPVFTKLSGNKNRKEIFFFYSKTPKDMC